MPVCPKNKQTEKNGVEQNNNNSDELKRGTDGLYTNREKEKKDRKKKGSIPIHEAPPDLTGWQDG